MEKIDSIKKDELNEVNGGGPEGSGADIPYIPLVVNDHFCKNCGNKSQVASHEKGYYCGICYTWNDNPYYFG